jgi:hypothetical protein
MSAQPVSPDRFIRKTQLSSNEYRKNFHQIDKETIDVITSAEADEVTPLMSKIYLRLVNAQATYWERDGILRFTAETREGKQVKAWSVLCDVIKVSSATANKAITWMHQQGVIGYFAGKNGVGLRIFINRAASSIGTRPGDQRKKILDFPRVSSDRAPGSSNETAFMETYGDIEISDIDFNSSAPKPGAATEKIDSRCANRSTGSEQSARDCDKQFTTHAKAHETILAPNLKLDEIVQRLRFEIEPLLSAIAGQAAAREHERTRDWLEKKGLPKAARVAQREAFNVLRHQGVIKESGSRAGLMVGRHEHVPYKPKLLSVDEIREVAEICVSMLEGHAQPIDVTLAEISTEAGGYLLAEDAPKVRDLAESLAYQRSQTE